MQQDDRITRARLPVMNLPNSGVGVASPHHFSSPCRSAPETGLPRPDLPAHHCVSRAGALQSSAAPAISIAVGVETATGQRFGDRLPFANETLGGAAVGPFAVGAGPLRGAVWTSPDGLSWSRLPDSQLPQQPDERVRLHAVTAGPEGLVAVGWGEGELIDPAVWTSPDGEAWTVTSDPERVLRGQGGQYMADVIADQSGVVAVGATGVVFGFNTAVWTSP